MAKRFIIDDATGALYEDFTARRVVSAADILEAEGGASETIQIYLVTHNPQTRAVTTTAISTANVSLDIGVPGASPTAGKVIVSYGGESTAELPVASLTADSLSAALNRLDAVESDGGVDVWPAGDPDQLNFYVRLQNTGAPGTNPSIDTDGTTPPSSAEVTVITAGSSSERALWLVQIAEAPVASIAESAWSTVTSGSFGGLTAALSLNGKGLLAHLAKDNPPPLTMTVKNSGSVLMRGTIPAFQAVDPADLNGSAIISIFPRIVTSTSNPTANDDSGDGYAVGTLWINTATPSAFLLMANTAGAANWDELTETGTGQLLAANNLSDLASASTARTNLGAQATITGAATTIDTEDLTASRAVISNGSGKIDVSDVTSTELGYLASVSSAVQTQLDYKLPLTGGTMSGSLTLGGTLDANYNLISNLSTPSGDNDAVTLGHLNTSLLTAKNDETGTSYTLVAGDARKTVRLNNASTVTVTVPVSVFSAGDVITLFRKGAGAVEISPVSGSCTINSVGTRRKLANQYSAATLICVTGGGTPEFDLIGDLKA